MHSTRRGDARSLTDYMHPQLLTRIKMLTGVVEGGVLREADGSGASAVRRVRRRWLPVAAEDVVSWAPRIAVGAPGGGGTYDGQGRPGGGHGEDGVALGHGHAGEERKRRSIRQSLYIVATEYISCSQPPVRSARPQSPQTKRLSPPARRRDSQLLPVHDPPVRTPLSRFLRRQYAGPDQLARRRRDQCQIVTARARAAAVLQCAREACLPCSGFPPRMLQPAAER